jgi:multiple sugar transport system ATP-binding protein
MAGRPARACGGPLLARIDLINVNKTLTERDATGPVSGAPRGARFSLQHVSLRIPDGETMVVLGPSGCGKTTLLKIIAGLIPPDSGDVRYDGVSVKDVSPGDRRIGMVFQNYALYPHFTAKKNVLSYFLFKKKTPELDALARAKYQRNSELLGVELADLLERKPTTLSGGEKQRVALGRCITRDAAVFLVDEPFANLDQALREKYRANLKTLLRQFNITTVYVTHDHHEALLLAHGLAVMDRGRIEQVGTPEEIYDTPKNLFVAGFLNLHVGTPPISVIEARSMPRDLGVGDAWVGVRPEDAQMSSDRSEGSLGGLVRDTLRLPLMNTTLCTVRVGEHDVHVQTTGQDRHVVGEEVWLTFKRFHVFDKASGLRLRTDAGTDA